MPMPTFDYYHSLLPAPSVVGRSSLVDRVKPQLESGGRPSRVGKTFLICPLLDHLESSLMSPVFAPPPLLTSCKYGGKTECGRRFGIFRGCGKSRAVLGDSEAGTTETFVLQRKG
jgi:hypothetical protein